LLWFVVMLTPSIFSVESPHWLRMAGALPPLVFLYAAGAQALTAWLARWLALARLLALLLAGLLAGSGSVTAYSYFSQWAQLPGAGRQLRRRPVRSRRGSAHAAAPPSLLDRCC
jgi:hypothetical protein